MVYIRQPEIPGRGWGHPPKLTSPINFSGTHSRAAASKVENYMQHYISEDDFPRACEIPELNRLSPEQRRFVWEWAHNGCDTKKAAIAAGMHEKSGYSLTKRQDIIDAITALTDRMLHSSAIPAIVAITEIVNDVAHKDRLKAAAMILNRTGWPEVHEHRVRVEKVPDEAAMVAAAVAMAKKLGMDPVALLGRNTPTLELKAELPWPAPLPDGSDI